MIISVMLLSVSIFYYKLEEKNDKFESELNKLNKEQYSFNLVSDYKFLVFDGIKTIKLNVDSSYKIKNDEYMVEFIGDSLSKEFEVFTGFDESSQSFYSKYTTENNFLCAKISIKNITNKPIAFDIGEFNLLSNTNSLFYPYMVLNYNNEVILNMETFVLQPELKMTVKVIFEVPNSYDECVLINDSLFGMKDKFSSWKMIYQICF